MLCYAAAGTKVQFGVIARPGVIPGETEDHPVFHSLLGPLDVQEPLKRIQLIHASLLTFCIIPEQAKQLPQQFQPLGLKVQRPHGTTITFLEDQVHKCVAVCDNPWLQYNKDDMPAVYAAVRGCTEIIQAVEPPKMSPKGKYSVRLHPVGTTLLATVPASELELRAAAR